MNSPLDNFAGFAESLEDPLRPDNNYAHFATRVGIQHWRYTIKRIYIDYMFSQPHNEANLNKIAQYRQLTEEKRWHEFAKVLTNLIQYQVEFVKNVPFFENLVQDDQIKIIKSCMFEMAVIRLSRLIDLERDLVLYVDMVMPIKDFVKVGDPLDVALMEEIFDAAKAIARLNLTETELGVFASLVLLLPDYHDTLNDQHYVERMHIIALGALKQEIEFNHPTPEVGDTVLDQLLPMTTTLRNLSVKHIEALRRFEAKSDPMKFPPGLYMEMFCNLPEDYHLNPNNYKD